VFCTGAILVRFYNKELTSWSSSTDGCVLRVGRGRQRDYRELLEELKMNGARVSMEVVEEWGENELIGEKEVGEETA
jgi:hypothetical protein